MSTDVAQADVVQPANGDTEQVSFQLCTTKKTINESVTNDWRPAFDSHVRCQVEDGFRINQQLRCF